MTKKTKKPRRVYLDADGNKLPSVTEVIGRNLGWSKDALMAWANKIGREGKTIAQGRDDAALKGQCVHAIVESILQDTPLDWEGFGPMAEALVAECTPNAERVVAWIKERYDVIACEFQFCHPFGYGGTIDLVLRDKATGETVIADLKTGKNVYSDVVVQLGAYTLGWDSSGTEEDPHNAIHGGLVIGAPFGAEITPTVIPYDLLMRGEDHFLALLEADLLRADLQKLF